MRAQKVRKVSLKGNRRIFWVIAIIAVALFFLCAMGTALYAVLGLGSPTQDANEAMNSIYATMTMEAAAREHIAQLTAQAPTPLPTLEPTSDAAPTSTLAPTMTAIPSRTPVLTMILPTREPYVGDSSSCNCMLVYECSDFSTHVAAQACFNSCGSDNWSNLDSDGDGVVCPNLP